MSAPVMAAEVLAGFIRTAFVDTYKRMITDVNQRLAACMAFGLPSDRSHETYAYFNAAPHPQRWVRGEDIPTEAYDDVTFQVVNYDWAKGVEWHANDRMDDQTKSLVPRAREVASGFALLRERCFFQVLTGAVDPLLLPAVPLAPDGAAFFSATDGGGNNRFGATNGNLIAGNGVANAQTVRSDIFNAIEQFRLFQDGKGQPLLPEGMLDMGFTVLFNVANWQLLAEALVQSRTLQTSSISVTGDTSMAGAAVTNIVLDSGMALTLWPTQRITDNDIYIIAKGVPLKPVFEQVRQPVLESLQLPENSDIARRTKKEGIFWNSRFGIGLTTPYSAVKINN